MIVSFTGRRDGITRAQSVTVQRLLAEFVAGGGLWPEFHHGDCLGADAQAAGWARLFGYRIVAHPPLQGVKRAFAAYDEVWAAKPYLARNHDVVDVGDVLLAAPVPRRTRSAAAHGRPSGTPAGAARRCTWWGPTGA